MSGLPLSALLEKYDVPVPRYTSYPAVPHWQETPAPEAWFDALNAALTPESASLAVYLHLPFCEVLCTFCGCNTVITRNHERSAPYVDVMLAELDRYLARVPALRHRPVSQIHLGGGTPTFMPPAVLEALLEGIAARLPLRADGYEGSVEVDPRVTTREHLDVMRANGLEPHLARRAGRRHGSAAARQPAATARDHRRALPPRARLRLRIDQLRLDLRAARAIAGDHGTARRCRCGSSARPAGRLQLRPRAVDQAGPAQVQGRRSPGRRREAAAV